MRMTLYRVADRDGRQALRGLARMRRVADAVGALGPRAAVTPVTMGGVPGELVRAPGVDRTARTVLYLHGGGFVLGSPRSHRGMAARLSAYAGCSVWLPHYRLAPEHPFPAAFDDAVTAYRWLLAHGHATPRTLVVAGDSAGGQLATAVIGALGTAAQPAAAGLLLFSPWLELDVAKLDASIRDPVLPTSYGYACRNAYLGAGDPTDPRLNVLTGDVAAFPPVLLQVGGTEILTGCANQFTATLQAAGVPVELQVWPGQIHVWPAFTPLVPEGKRALQIAARFITDRTSQT
jgi:acetyl esterase/lipase